MKFGCAARLERLKKGYIESGFKTSVTLCKNEKKWCDDERIMRGVRHASYPLRQIYDAATKLVGNITDIL